MEPAVATANFELSLLELIQGFMEHAYDSGEPSFPLHESWLWHDFLFALTNFNDQFPALGCIGPFDWDDASPKCRSFDVVMFKLRYQSFSRGPNGRIFINTETRRERNLLLKHMPILAHQAVELARNISGFF